MFRIQREDLTASDTVEALFEDIYNAAFKTNYDYLISYNAPLSIMSKSDHSTVVKTLGNLKAGFTYVLDYSGTENFIYDIDASQYPLISFSYYKDDHHYNLNMMNLYENLTRNKNLVSNRGNQKKSIWCSFLKILSIPNIIICIFWIISKQFWKP